MVKKIKGNITEIQADVIVNAANTELAHGGGVARAIAMSAGEELIKESDDIGFVPLGDFAATTAGNLKAKEVVHIPTIDYTKGGKKITYEELKNAWRKTLQYCRDKGYKSIATPLLGGGIVGLDKEKVENILSKTSSEFENLQVIIVEL